MNDKYCKVAPILAVKLPPHYMAIPP